MRRRTVRASGGTVSVVGRRAAVAAVAAAVLVAIVDAGAATAASASHAPGRAVSGAHAWAATRRAGSAAVQMWVPQAGSPPDGRPDRLHFHGGIDWRRHRSWLRVELPGLAVLGHPARATRVEMRTIDGVTYVRDGSWLCPGCGMDGGRPLPEDKWIRASEPSARSRFGAESLAVLGSQNDPVPALRTVQRGGTTLTVHRTRVGRRWLEFVVDGHDRVRRVAYGAHLGGGRAREVVTFDRFGAPQPVRRPPARDVYRGPI